MSTSGTGQRGFLVALIGVGAFVLGICAGVLSWLGGTPATLAVLAGFVSFGGSVAFVLRVLLFVRKGE